MVAYFAIGKYRMIHLLRLIRFEAVVLFCVLLISIPSAGQEIDSLFQRFDKVNGIRTDGLDSISKVKSDSLKIKAKLDSVSAKLNTSIDSLSKLKLPKQKYYSKVDSLMKSAQEGLRKNMATHSDSLKTRSNEMVAIYQSKLERKRQRLDSLNSKYKLGLNMDQSSGLDLGFDASEFKMAEFGTPEFANPDMPTINTPQTNLPHLSVPSLDIPGVNNINENIEKVKDYSDEATEYTEKIDELKKTDVKEEAKKLPGKIEEKVENSAAIEEIKKELPGQPNVSDLKGGVPDQITSKVKDLNISQAGQEVGKRTKKALVDHFSGKEEVVKSGLSQLEKHQKKYNSVADIRYLPKHKSSSLKDKPFFERITPGIAFRIFVVDSDWKGVEISPSVEYLFSTNFRAGFAVRYDMNINTKDYQVQNRDHVYSFRTMANYKFSNKGLYAHLEFEAIHSQAYLITPVPNQSDLNMQVWDYSINTGIFKSYKLSKKHKNLKGTLLVLYDLTQLDETFNLSKVAMRFGVELTIKKKKENKEPGISK